MEENNTELNETENGLSEPRQVRYIDPDTHLTLPHRAGMLPDNNSIAIEERQNDLQSLSFTITCIIIVSLTIFILYKLDQLDKTRNR